MRKLPRCASSIYFEHRRRIQTEETAKAVSAVWGTEVIQFLAELAIFHQENFEQQDELILFFTVYHPGSIHPNLQIVLAWQKTWINSVPQTAATTFAFSSVFILLLVP